MIEPDEKEIEKYRNSLHAVLHDCGVNEMINCAAEAYAYQIALNKHNMSIILETIKEDRKRNKDLKPTLPVTEESFEFINND